MRALVLTIMAIAISFGSIACNKKKNESNTRSGRGYHAGTSPGQSGMGSQVGSGWDALENLQKSDVRNNNMNNAAHAFLSASVPEDQIGSISGNYPENVVVAMSISRDSNGFINQTRTRLGLIFWDSYSQQGAAPLTAYFGPEVGTSTDGRIQGNRVTVDFQDNYGTVKVDGQIQGSTFAGTITFQNGNSGQQLLGNFSLPVNSSIF